MRLYSLLILLTLAITSCQKEVSIDGIDPYNPPGNNNGGNNGGNENGACNNTVMKLKKWVSAVAADNYVEAAWNTDGTIKSIKMNTQLSEYRTAVYRYANGRISDAILYSNHDNKVIDTAVFHYNAAGKVDSMYLKNDSWFDIKLTYTQGKLTKYTRYADGAVMFYLNVQTDGNDNVTKAEEFFKESSGFKLQSTHTWTRDDKKSPFAGIAQYMLYLDDAYNIFWYWGPNNYVTQRYQDHTGTGTDLTTGFKFKYNNNCYPASSQITIMGQVIFNDDDYRMTYY